MPFSTLANNYANAVLYWNGNCAAGECPEGWSFQAVPGASMTYSAPSGSEQLYLDGLDLRNNGLSSGGCQIPDVTALS